MKWQIQILFWFSISFLWTGFVSIFKCMNWAEQRNGFDLFDPVQYLLPPPVDLSYVIFFLIYFGVIASIIQSYREGLTRLSFALIGYAFILYFRSLTILVFPLNPPFGMIPLNDPMVDLFSSEKIVFTKDLFFSGHTATLVYLFLIARNNMLKRFLLGISLIVIGGILIQRVHYSFDIGGGFLFAWIIFKIISKLESKFKISSQSLSKLLS